MSLSFNQTCLNERLQPNYTFFKIHGPAAHYDTDTQKYRCSLVKRKINYNKDKINTLALETKTLIRKLERIFNHIDKMCLYYLMKHAWMKDCCQLYIYIYIYEEHMISFQTFFVWALLSIVHTWNSSPLRSNLLQLQCTCCTVPTTSGRPHGSPLMWASQWPSLQPLSSPQLSHNDSLWA